METAAAAVPSAKRRRTQAHEGRELEATLAPPPHELLPPTDAHSGLTNGPEPEESHGEEPPRGAGGQEEDGVDRISLLPDDILGEIVSLLPTKEAARTRTLASRWRDIWPSSPLNIDCGGHGGGIHRLAHVEVDRVARIIALHGGPVRRLCVPVDHIHRYPAAIDAWLCSAAHHNIQELEFDRGDYYYGHWTVSLPVDVLRCSATLRVLTISACRFPESAVEVLRFPQLRQLGLEEVQISEGSLNSIISGSPVLEFLLLFRCHGFDSIRINSPSLVSVGFNLCIHPTWNLIIEDAPSLERLLQLEDFGPTQVVSVISAPKLETLGYLTSSSSKYTLGTTILQDLKLKVNDLATEVRSVKTLAINIYSLDLDTVIDLIRFFPCLEKLYIQTSNASGCQNLWRHKHRNLVKCLDLRLKTIVLKNYRGVKSQVNFATFFVLNAKRLEVMRFERGAYSKKNYYIEDQHRLLQLEKRASRSARFYFTRSRCHGYLPHIKHVGDLSKTEPFECSSMCVL